MGADFVEKSYEISVSQFPAFNPNGQWQVQVQSSATLPLRHVDITKTLEYFQC